MTLKSALLLSASLLLASHAAAEHPVGKFMQAAIQLAGVIGVEDHGTHFEVILAPDYIGEGEMQVRVVKMARDCGLKETVVFMEGAE